VAFFYQNEINSIMIYEISNLILDI